MSNDRCPSFQPADAWRLVLLGAPLLSLGRYGELRLERKVAGLLAYLAVQGETPRGRLATLLWPGGEESVARNNLAQAIRRLKQAAGGLPLVDGQARLRLADHLQPDLLAADPAGPAPASGGDPSAVGELLAGLDYSDCPEFDEWLQVNRRLLENRRAAALETLADRAEAEHDLRAAVAHAQHLLAGDPYCEAHHRRLMRLFWLLGDRNAALAASRRCRQMLLGELGVAPAAETLSLEHDILRGHAAAKHGPVARPGLPPALLRPPQLVERDFLLSRMAAAWESGQAIFVEGPPGVGKTRLMQEFLARHGRFYTFQARPAERNIPYAGIARQLRETLRAFPALLVPEGARSALAGLLPELGEPGRTVAPGYQPLHLYSALAEIMALAVAAGMRRQAFDNLHLLDQASIDALHFACLEQWDRRNGAQLVFCYRRDGLGRAARLLVDTVLAMDRGILIRVDDLSGAGVARLVAAVAPERQALAGELYRLAGGNPLFSLETLRMLHSMGSADEEAEAARSGQLPMPRKVRHVLEQRLAALSPRALQLARLAALAGDGFQPAVAEALLGLSPYIAAALWAELANAQLLVGWRFVHEFARRAVLDSLPEVVRQRLTSGVPETDGGSRLAENDPG